MTLVLPEKDCLTHKNQTFEAFTYFLSHKLDQDLDQDHKDPLGQNKPAIRLLKTPAEHFLAFKILKINVV